MMRYYMAPDQWSADEMVLSGDEAHHLLHVLKGAVDDKILLMDGKGRQAVAQVEEASRREARVSVLRQTSTAKPEPELTLIQAVPREQKMDLIIQKATELGVSHIVPVISDTGVVRLKEGQHAAKLKRWNKIALSAAKQSGCLWLPKIHPVMTLLHYLEEMPRSDLFMTCSLEPDALPLKEVIEASRSASPRSVSFLVGPEGDFTARERAAARNAGARMVSLGNQVLRSETAALYIVSILQYEYHEFSKEQILQRATEAL